ncbi:hypothetical protein BO71DRAFT_11116 [Aspergillus ellipticus CBS 707.79]|uniref:Uncharacterized protein n=1 Tax=Aspergillus ellipticus CBS 707.79 TaxID=1448320 RepID=A0A319DXN4_9EURO|nr:hypothetical protein BO71DRAFT_11116 [Aspergillus ellipticus CBS 707.79]
MSTRSTRCSLSRGTVRILKICLRQRALLSSRGGNRGPEAADRATSDSNPDVVCQSPAPGQGPLRPRNVANRSPRRHQHPQPAVSLRTNSYTHVLHSDKEHYWPRPYFRRDEGLRPGTAYGWDGH